MLIARLRIRNHDKLLLLKKLLLLTEVNKNKISKSREVIKTQMGQLQVVEDMIQLIIVITLEAEARLCNRVLEVEGKVLNQVLEVEVKLLIQDEVEQITKVMVKDKVFLEDKEDKEETEEIEEIGEEEEEIEEIEEEEIEDEVVLIVVKKDI